MERADQRVEVADRSVFHQQVTAHVLLRVDRSRHAHDPPQIAHRIPVQPLSKHPIGLDDLAGPVVVITHANWFGEQPIAVVTATTEHHQRWGRHARHQLLIRRPLPPCQPASGDVLGIEVHPQPRHTHHVVAPTTTAEGGHRHPRVAT